MKKKSIVSGFKIILGVAIGLVLIIYFYKLSLTKVFTLSNGDRLVIKRASSWEVTIPYDYLIKRKDKIIIPETFFYSQWPQKNATPTFELVYSDDKKMVAVVTKEDPKTTLIIYDMESNRSIPHEESHESVEDNISRQHKMLDKFNNNKYDYTFQAFKKTEK